MLGKSCSCHLSASRPQVSSAVPRRPFARFRSRALSAGAFVLAILLPKCPLCVAAWAAALGLGAVAQRFLAFPLSSSLRPWLIVLLVSPLLVQLTLTVRRRLIR